MSKPPGNKELASMLSMWAFIVVINLALWVGAVWLMVWGYGRIFG